VNTQADVPRPVVDDDPLGDRRGRPLWRRVLAWSAVAIALASVFVAYLNPHLAMQVANAVWACF
jgi:hypothetical protein